MHSLLFAVLVCMLVLLTGCATLGLHVAGTRYERDPREPTCKTQVGQRFHVEAYCTDDSPQFKGLTPSPKG